MNERVNNMFNKIISNETINYSNYKLWSVDRDRWLKDYVIIFNFNFKSIADKFQEVIAFPLKYDYTEDEVRKHWMFLHAARELNIEVDNHFYNQLKEKNAHFVEKEKEIEEENIKEIQKQIDLEKIKAERFEFSLGKKNETNTKEAVPELENPAEVADEQIEKSEKVEENLNEEINKEEVVEPVNSQQKINEYAEEQSKNILALEEEEDQRIFNEIIKTKKHYMEEKFDFKDEESLFPISIKKTEIIDDKVPDVFNTQNLESSMVETQDMDTYIKENEDLQKHNEDLNTMYNFTMKSLNTQLALLNNPQKKEEMTEDELRILKASEEINKLINEKVL